MSNQFYYITQYPLNLCLEYMNHDNIYDRFAYTWEKKGDRYFITFNEYKNSILSLATSPKPVFEVIFENLGENTGIQVRFLKSILSPVPFVYIRDIDLFWEEKLNAKKCN